MNVTELVEKWGLIAIGFAKTEAIVKKTTTEKLKTSKDNIEKMILVI